MKGVIVNINRDRSRLAVAAKNGLSLVEVLAKVDGVLRIGDDVEGELETIGEHQMDSTRGRIRVRVHQTGQTAAKASTWVWKQ